ncbi:MAG: caspase family protein, partial [Desulfobacterales bacterium]
ASFCILFFLHGCVKQFQVPDSETSAMKDFQRVVVYGNVRPWTKTKININKGDQILIIASGSVTTWPGHSHSVDLPPHRRLVMKIGKKGIASSAVGWNNQMLFRSTEEGLLMFCVRDWDSLDEKGRPVMEVYCRVSGCDYYADNRGHYQIEVFVFSDSAEDEIINTLKKIAEANPDDEELRSAIEVTLSDVYRYRILEIASTKASKEISQTKEMIKEIKEQAKVNEPSQESISELKFSDSDNKKIQELEQKLAKLTETLNELDKLKNELEEGRKQISVLSQELEEKEELERDLKSKLEHFENSPPVIVIASPKDNSEVTSKKATLYGVAKDDKGVTKLEVIIGNQVSHEPIVRDLKFAEEPAPKRVEFNKTINLQTGINKIEIRATNSDNLVSKETIVVYRRELKKNIWAVIIGIDEYQHIRKLKYAVDDAQAFYRHFVNYMQLPQENIILLTNEQANLTKLRSTLGTYLKRKAGKEDTVFIYFAGHGSTEKDSMSPDGDGLTKYLLPCDAMPNDLYATALPMSEIKKIFDRIKSDRLIFICDACYSGASGGRTISLTGLRANISDVFLDRIVKGKGRVIITASGPNEVSSESDELQHGIFTYFLLKGLHGKADTDNDGLITVDELYKYVSIEVPDATNQEQHPVKKGSVEGQIVIGYTQ